MRKLLLAAVAVLASAALAVSASAADVTPSFAGAPTGWTVDRQAPASFADIGTYQGHANVLGIGVGTASTSSPFYNTQGMGTPILSGGVGDSVSAQLYVPATWMSSGAGSVRTDMWAVVNDSNCSSGGCDYPIIGFTNYGTSTGSSIFVGFRAWDSMHAVWDNLNATVLTDAWNTLQITDLSGNLFQYSVNGSVFATIAGDVTDTTFSKLLMQGYDFNGVSGATPVAYTAHWSNTQNVPEPSSFLVFGAGLIGLGLIRRHDRKKKSRESGIIA